MTTKKDHLNAIFAMRMDWSEQDRLMAKQLADIRYKLERERAKSTRAPATVPTMAGGEKPNPIFAVIEKLAKQERQLTRGLNLGAKRTAAGRYEANASPIEVRTKLWEANAARCVDNLEPGAWLFLVQEAGVDIDEDSKGWPNNPMSLPVAGQDHEVGSYYSKRPQIREAGRMPEKPAK